jgi:hypothetical protein
VFAGDTVSFSDTSASFADANAGIGKTVEISGITLGGADAGNYLLTTTTATTTANITPLAITVTATGTNKVYDATLNDPVTLASSGVLAGDVVSFSDTSATFGNKNVGTAKPVTVTGITALGPDAPDYSVNTTATTTATITPKELGLNLQGQGTKLYDGTSTIHLSGVTPSLTGILLGDSVTVGVGSVTGFVDPNVGTDKSVTFTGFALAGTDAGNYQLLSSIAPSTASIAPAPINLSGTRVYDGGIDASAAIFSNGGTISGVAGQTLTLTGSGTLASKNAGSESVTGLGTLSLGNGAGASGGLAGNYTLVGGVAAVNVTPLGILVTAVGANKIYDGTTLAAVTLSSSGVLPGDSVSFSDTSATFDTRNVGSGKTITVSGIAASGTDGGNYSIGNVNASATTTASITPATITVAGATGVDKTYDGTTALPAGATGFTSGGVLAIDAGAVTISAANAAYASPGVGPEAVDVLGLTLSGSAAGNYRLSATNVTGAGTITAAAGGGGTAGGSGTGQGSGSGSSGGSGGSGGITLPGLTAGGSSNAGGYVLSGTAVSSTADRNGTTTTVVGSFSNGVATLTGTFIIQPRADAGDGLLPDELASNASDVVTFVPGTLRARISQAAMQTGFAPVASRAAWNEDGALFEALPAVFPVLDDPDLPWEAIDRLGSPGFDQTIICIADHCTVVARLARTRAGAAIARH